MAVKLSTFSTRGATSRNFSFPRKFLANKQDRYGERTAFVYILRMTTHQKDCRQAGRRLDRIIQREYKRFFCPIRRQYSESFLDWSGKTLSPWAPCSRSNFYMPIFPSTVLCYFLPAFSRFPSPTNCPWVSVDVGVVNTRKMPVVQRTCTARGKQNHYANICRSNPQEKKGYCPQQNKTCCPSVARATCIPNLSTEPCMLKRHWHFCQVTPVFEPKEDPSTGPSPAQRPLPRSNSCHSASIQVDPDSILSHAIRANFQSLLRV